MRAKTVTRNSNAQAENRGPLKIGEVSRISGVGIEALRFYEKSGLLDTPARTGSGYRLYPAEVLERAVYRPPPPRRD